jgi:hypothetical protein
MTNGSRVRVAHKHPDPQHWYNDLFFVDAGDGAAAGEPGEGGGDA